MRKYIGMNHFPPPPGLDRRHGWHGPGERTYGPLPVVEEGRVRLPVLPEEIRRENTRKAMEGKAFARAERARPWAPVDPWREPAETMEAAKQHFAPILASIDKVKP